MIEIVESRPTVDVQPAEYLRLLGYPRGFELQDRARELADWARDWYARHGRPWVYARQAAEVQTSGDAVHLDGLSFTSPPLLKTLRDAGADGAVLVAVSAGPELEQEAQVRWRDGKPDEYFFLEVYGSAVVEHLMTTTGARLCAWADARAQAVLPHYSPGYPEWDVSEQPRLLRAVGGAAWRGAGLGLEALESGMLRPKKSLLAVFGVTPHVERVRRLTDLIPCENCAFNPCQFRRAPYRRALDRESELSGAAGSAAELEVLREPGTSSPAYSVNAKALRRWADERLSIERDPDGSIRAVFRYDGTTCTNMGRPLQFQYQVTLGPRAGGHTIREQHCGPAPGDVGHTWMCEYRAAGAPLLAAIAAEAPLRGRPLADVLTWTRARAATGCYCDADSRQHKWGLVLETIHYALARASADGGDEETTL